MYETTLRFSYLHTGRRSFITSPGLCRRYTRITSYPDPSVCALSINPVITPAPTSVIINPRIVRTIITPQATGVVIFESVPTNASVYIDGTLKGTTPLTLRTITTGSHEVVFQVNRIPELHHKSNRLCRCRRHSVRHAVTRHHRNSYPNSLPFRISNINNHGHTGNDNDNSSCHNSLSPGYTGNAAESRETKRFLHETLFRIRG